MQFKNGFNIAVTPEIVEAFKRISADYSAIHTHLQPILEQVGKNLKTFADRLPNDLKTLASHGWYVSSSSIPTDIYEVVNYLNKGEFTTADDTLSISFQEELDPIISRASRLYPERECVLNEAKKAHHMGMYFASTALFLSTADGIVNGILFSLDKLTRAKVNPDDFQKLFLQVIPINESMHSGQKKRYLNRNGVMHRYDTTYGTKINSLKALSLLGYIIDFFVAYPEPDNSQISK